MEPPSSDLVDSSLVSILELKGSHPESPHSSPTNIHLRLPLSSENVCTHTMATCDSPCQPWLLLAHPGTQPKSTVESARFPQNSLKRLVLPGPVAWTCSIPWCTLPFCESSYTPRNLIFGGAVLVFCFFMHLWHTEVSRLGVKLEPQVLAYTTATAMPDP